ncbi:serine hydrolase [Streptomyces sp. NPDC002138]|uniref:serine hydrolase n=1 Tax=Streptomyces sp. NPDC002138 TaxID=3154410 RepID=UPI0033192CD2
MKAVSVAGESSGTSKSAQGSTADTADTPTPEPAPPEATPAPAPADPDPSPAPAPAPGDSRSPEDASPDPTPADAGSSDADAVDPRSAAPAVETAPVPDSDSDTEPKPARRPELELEPGSADGAESETLPPREAARAAEPEPASGARALPDGDDDGDAEDEGDGPTEDMPAAAEIPEPEAEPSEPESEPESVPDAASGSEAEAGTEPGSRAGADAGPEAAGEAGSAAGSASRPRAGAGSGADVAPGSGDEADGEAGSRAEAEDAPEGVGKASSAAATRSGGEDEGEDGAVPESDSERTSKFITLKPLEGPGAPAGAPDRDAAPAWPKVPASTPTWAKGPARTTAPAPTGPPASQAKGSASAPTGAPATRVKGSASAPTGAPAATPAKGPAAPAAPAWAKVAAPAKGAVAPPQTAPPASASASVSPPLPPLDLLAQLTNTPPPAETAARTVVRRFKIWTPVLLALIGAAVVAQTVRPLPAPTLATGEAAVSFTFDGTYTAPWPAAGQGAIRVVGTGDVGSFGEQKPVPIASVAKVMTAYVILTGHPLKKGEAGPLIEIDAKTVADGTSADESRVEGLTVGAKFSEQDVLEMLLIPSANNAARLLARWDTNSDSEGAFVEKMNAAAKQLGMKDTTYTDPSGLDAGTRSTAEDQLKLAEAVMRIDAFRAIVRLPNATVNGLKTPLDNNNGNLLLSGLNIMGIKTGSSSAAGGALMWAAYKSVGGKDQLIIGATLEQRAPAPDKDAINSLALVKDNSKKIIESVRAALTAAGAVKKGQVVGYVDDGLGKRTPLVATRDVQAVGVPGQKVRLRLADGGKPLPHAAKAGTQVGELVLGDGPGARAVPLALKESLAEPSFGAKLLRMP